ncbi:MAG: ROK family protein [Planctomycetota bacterium]
MSKANDHYFIGIDLGGTNIQAGIYRSDKKIDRKNLIIRDGAKTKASEGGEAVLDRIEKLCRKLIEKAGLEPAGIGGLGIGAPGAVDIDEGVVMRAPNLGWTDFKLAKKLSDRFPFKVTVDNDVNVGAWGEYMAGAGRGHRDLMAVFVGTGVGAGIVLHERLYHGVQFTAGEIGHTVIEGSGVLGRRTVEDVGSRTSMVRRLVRLIQSYHASVVPELVDGDLSRVRSKILAQAQQQGDALTLEIIADAAEYIGIAIANSVTLLSLPCVVVGGGATEALGEAWLDQVRAAFTKHVFPKDLATTTIVASVLEDDAGVIGAALLAEERLG